MQTIRAFSLAALLSMTAVACSAPKPEPEIASSAAEPGYAQDYPDTLQSIVKDFGRDDDDAKTLSSQFRGYPGELKAPDWAVVLEIYGAADQAGKSYAYVERNREVEGARAFYDAEKDEINKKVAGAATYVAKQKSCDVELSGTVSHALDEIVEKKLEERMREQNEAHHILDRNRVLLGKENAAALEKQADNISRASYLVNIAMVEEKVRLKALLEEAEQVGKTIDEFIASERAFQGKGSRSDAEKKESDARIERAQKSKAKIESAVSQGNEITKKIEERIQEAQKRHEEAIKALKDDVSKQANKAGQK